MCVLEKCCYFLPTSVCLSDCLVTRQLTTDVFTLMKRVLLSVHIEYLVTIVYETKVTNVVKMNRIYIVKLPWASLEY